MQFPSPQICRMPTPGLTSLRELPQDLPLADGQRLRQIGAAQGRSEDSNGVDFLHRGQGIPPSLQMRWGQLRNARVTWRDGSKIQLSFLAGVRDCLAWPASQCAYRGDGGAITMSMDNMGDHQLFTVQTAGGGAAKGACVGGTRTRVTTCRGDKAGLVSVRRPHQRTTGAGS